MLSGLRAVSYTHLIVFAIIAVASAVINYNAEKPISMPSLVGMTQKSAQEAVKDITPTTTVTYEYSSQAEQGIVIGQEPEPGVQVKPGDPLSIVVSNGTGTDTMPDVTNIDITQAQKYVYKRQV